MFRKPHGLVLICGDLRTQWLSKVVSQSLLVIGAVGALTHTDTEKKKGMSLPLLYQFSMNFTQCLPFRCFFAGLLTTCGFGDWVPPVHTVASKICPHGGRTQFPWIIMTFQFLHGYLRITYSIYIYNTPFYTPKQ